MAFPRGCLDSPPALLKERLCVHNVSKNARGTLERNVSKGEKCGDPECLTLKTVHRFKVELRRHDCDSPLGASIDGTLVVERLVTAFDRDGHQRGVHAGDFQWFIDGGGSIRGRISGITNAGTHRAPVFDPCERCHLPGVFTGRLCGEVADPPSAELRGAKIVALYQVRYDPSVEGGSGEVRGTLEGVLVAPCLKP